MVQVGRGTADEAKELLESLNISAANPIVCMTQACATLLWWQVECVLGLTRPLSDCVSDITDVSCVQDTARSFAGEKSEGQKYDLYMSAMHFDEVRMC